MKLFLYLAAMVAVAVAVAVPVQQGPIVPGPDIPATVVREESPIANGSTIFVLSPISVGPASVEPVATNRSSAPMVYIEVNIDTTSSAGSPVTITIGPININGQVFSVIVPVQLNLMAVGPIQIVNHVSGPVNFPEAKADSATAPIVQLILKIQEIAEPSPNAVTDDAVVGEATVPGPVDIVDNVEVEPVVVETPTIVDPAVVHPEALN